MTVQDIKKVGYKSPENTFYKAEKAYFGQKFQYTSYAVKEQMPIFVILLVNHRLGNGLSIFSDQESREMTLFSMLASQESLKKDWENEDDDFWNEFL